MGPHSASKWHSTASLTASRKSSMLSASVKIGADYAFASYPPSGDSTTEKMISTDIPTYSTKLPTPDIRPGSAYVIVTSDLRRALGDWAGHVSMFAVDNCFDKLSSIGFRQSSLVLLWRQFLARNPRRFP